MPHHVVTFFPNFHICVTKIRFTRLKVQNYPSSREKTNHRFLIQIDEVLQLIEYYGHELRVKKGRISRKYDTYLMCTFGRTKVTYGSIFFQLSWLYRWSFTDPLQKILKTLTCIKKFAKPRETKTKPREAE